MGQSENTQIPKIKREKVNNVKQKQHDPET